MQLELFFKIRYVCKNPKGFGIEQDLTKFAVKILCGDSSGCNEVDNYFATEADTMMNILFDYDLDEDSFRIFTLNRNIY